MMIQILGLWLFSAIVYLLTWESEKEAIRRKLKDYYSINVTDRSLTAYQLAALMVKTSSVTLLCMVIGEACTK